jgi:hypothetical protein
MGVNDRGRVYECLKCPRFKGEKRKAESHFYKIHLAPDELPWYCSLCNFRCESERDMKRHPIHYPDHKRRVDKAKRKNPGVEWDDTQFFLRNSNPKVVVIGTDLRLWSKEDSDRFWGTGKQNRV